MFCPKCGTKNEKSSLFCGKCGRPLTAQTTSTPPSTAPSGKTKKKIKPGLKAVIIIGSILAFLVIAFLIAYAAGLIHITTSTQVAAVPVLPGTATPSTSAPLLIDTPAPPTKEPEPNNTPFIVPTPNRNAQLTDDHVWLVYVNQPKGIMAVNSDGGGPNQVFRMPLSVSNEGTPDIPIGFNPWYKDYLVLRVQRDDRFGFDLMLVHLPDLETKIIAPLISDENLQGVDSYSDIDINLRWAILEGNAIRWSPNGRYLAFAAAIDGPSSDLYVYDMETDGVTRLSSGSLHVATPYWTADSEQIFYQAVKTFVSGAGWNAKSTWVVDLATQTPRHLYDFTDDTSSVTPLGITQDNFILLRTFSQSNPDLRFVDLATGAVNILATGMFPLVDLNPQTGAVIFNEPSDCLNFVSKPTDTPRCVSQVAGEILFITPDDIIHGFTISTNEGTYAIDQNGTLTKIFEQPGILTRSINGSLICFSGNNLECGFGSSPTELHNVTNFPDVKVIMWTDVDFFFVDDGDLYYVSTNNWTPTLIDDNLLPVNYNDFQFYRIGWLMAPG